MRLHIGRLMLLVVWISVPVSLLAQEEKPANNGNRPVVRVVYFIPTDRKPEPEFQVRLDRVMEEVQQFYRVGMDQNGYGKITFELDRDAKGKLRIYEVKAKGPMKNYGRDASDKVCQEVKQALAKEKIDIDRETIIIFQLLLEWRGDKAIEIGPYVGGGGPFSGTAWVYDDAKLDPQWLSSRKPGGYYNGPCSLGQFNTHYIGGVAHELGHALGLPHDCERDVDRPRFGASLMGGGNHTYGQEQRNEGKGAFLSAASALPLSVHPLFTGKRKPPARMTCELTELQPTFEKQTLQLTGQLQGGPRVIGLVAHNDPQKPVGDYDAVGWTCPVDPQGKFRLLIGEMKPGDYQLRITAYGASGESKTFAFSYRVDSEKRPDLKPFREGVGLQQAHKAFRDRNEKRLAEMVADLKNRYPPENEFRRKVEHLQKLLKPTKLRSLAEIPAKETSILLSDLNLEVAKVGWGQPLRNQVLLEGESSCLLEVGGTFWESGFYAHAPAQHVLRLEGKWSRFIAKYGLQDGHDGSVVFVLKGDGKELVRSKPVKDHIVREFNVDISKVKQLELIVEDAADGANSDWGVWLSPQLQR